MTVRSAWDDDGKVLRLRQAIACLTETKGPEFARKIETIIFESHSKKTFNDFSATGENNTPQNFVDLIVAFYEQSHDKVENLQLHRSEDEWQKIYPLIYKRAYDFLRQKGFHYGLDTDNYAEECAQEAAVQILKSNFHYLSAFESWVTVLVQNVCRKRISNDKKPDGIPVEKISSYEENLLADLYHDGDSSDPIASEVDRRLLRKKLRAALKQLTSEERQIINWYYFTDPKWTLEKIAAQLGKSTTTCQRRLKKTLEKLHGFLNE